MSHVALPLDSADLLLIRSLKKERPVCSPHDSGFGPGSRGEVERMKSVETSRPFPGQLRLLPPPPTSVNSLLGAPAPPLSNGTEEVFPGYREL